MFKDTKANKIFMIILLLLVFLVVTGKIYRKTETSTYSDLNVENGLYIESLSDINIWVDDSLKNPEIIYRGNRKNFSVDRNGSSTTVKEKLQKFFFFNISWDDDNNLITVKLPSSQMNELKINTVGGDINTFNTLNIKNIDITSISGDLELQDIESDRLKIKTTSGDISLTSVNAPNSTFNSISGDFEINRLVTDNLSMNTTSGDIDIFDLKIATNGSFKTVSGDIYLLTNVKTENINVKSLSGEVLLNNPDNPQNNNTLNVSSTSGDININ